MAQSIAQALTRELDIYTPCIFGVNGEKEEENLSRTNFLIKVILRTCSEKFTKRQQDKVVEALKFSALHHKGVRRKDGFTPYFMHLLEVVQLLFSFKIFDFKLTVAAILHDVVEDTKVTLKEINTLFGSAIRNIVDLMTKHPNFVRKWRYWSIMKEEADLNCRWRVIVLKFMDRIHNLMTLDAVPEEDRRSKIWETEQEFPSLYRTLCLTLKKLKKRGTLKNKEYFTLPFPPNTKK